MNLSSHTTFNVVGVYSKINLIMNNMINTQLENNDWVFLELFVSLIIVMSKCNLCWIHQSDFSKTK